MTKHQSIIVSPKIMHVFVESIINSINWQLFKLLFAFFSFLSLRHRGTC